MAMGVIRDEVGFSNPNWRVTSSCTWSQVADRHDSCSFRNELTSASALPAGISEPPP